MVIRQVKQFVEGYNSITSLDDKVNETLMDYGILKLAKDQVFTDDEDKEKAYLLIKGSVVFEWENNKVEAHRESFLDENPCCLHVPSHVAIKLTSLSDDTEISVSRTLNDKSFAPKYYSQQECASENRGAGTMAETSTRVVRTIFDYSVEKQSNLVLGEVITYPGKWSSYPPHHHKQPEIYFYKFYPEQGLGFAMLGDDVVKVKNNDTVLILDDVSHPQTAGPGYAMYYVWVIRHLDNNPYIKPVFEPEHLWVTDKNAKIWPEK